jgi:hypothetical protein
METPEVVERAILAQYGQLGPEAQAESIQWLLNLLDKPSAWEIGVHFLGHSSELVEFFCANMLLTKVHNCYY